MALPVLAIIAVGLGGRLLRESSALSVADLVKSHVQAVLGRFPGLPIRCVASASGASGSPLLSRGPVFRLALGTVGIRPWSALRSLVWSLLILAVLSLSRARGTASLLGGGLIGIALALGCEGRFRLFQGKLAVDLSVLPYEIQ